MRVYIAGPMSGLEDDNFPSFHAAEKMLRQLGFDVFNPAIEDEPKDETLAWYLARDLPELCRCDAIALLPGWRESKGARAEHAVAQALGLLQLEIPHWMTLYGR